MTFKQKQQAAKDFQQWWLFTVCALEGELVISMRKEAKEKIEELYMELRELQILTEKMDTAIMKHLTGERPLEGFVYENPKPKNPNEVEGFCQNCGYPH